MSFPFRGRTLGAAVSILTLCATGHAVAAGFFIKEMSVTGLGRAFAGAPAAADDASTVWFNPAGMTSLPANEVEAAVHLIAPQTELTNDGSKKANSGGTFVPATDNSTQTPYDATPIPNLFGVVRDADRGFALGFGVTAPFGMANEYSETWFGRFDSIKTDLKTYNYSLVGAYDINRYVTIGGGVDYQIAEVTLTSMKNNSGTELHSTLEGNDNGLFGFNAGVLVHATPDTDVGLHYRSGFTHPIEGTATLRSDSSSGAIASQYAAKADLGLPELASLGVKHRLNGKVTLLGDVSYYGWSAFDAIKVYQISNGVLKEDIPQKYKDTVSFGLGVDYAYDDALTLRAGVQYDPTPTQDEYRTSRTPDSDRTWISGGLTYKMSENLLMDAAFTYIHLHDTKLDLDRSATVGGATSAVIGADVSGFIVIGAVALRYRF